MDIVLEVQKLVEENEQLKKELAAHRNSMSYSFALEQCEIEVIQLKEKVKHWKGAFRQAREAEKRAKMRLWFAGLPKEENAKL